MDMLRTTTFTEERKRNTNVTVWNTEPIGRVSVPVTCFCNSYHSVGWMAYYIFIFVTIFLLCVITSEGCFVFMVEPR
jgi:hypothetical protein